MNFIRNLMEEVSHDLHIHSQPSKIKCGAPLEKRMKMNIIEATKKAVDENKAIYRKSLPHIKFVPTNSKNAAFILFSDDDSPAGRMWNPMAKDILSNDWEVLN